MVKRSLQSNQTGIEKSKKAFQRKGWTQEYLASQVGLETRQSVWKFFTGRPIERSIFIDICFQLDLDWQEIANLSYATDLPTQANTYTELENSANINSLVARTRSVIKPSLIAQCGILSLTNISQPIGLDDIYVNTNILQEINHQRWLEISDLASPISRGRVNLSQGNNPAIPGITPISNYPKLMLLGKPGSGKTTFLQSVALQCIRGELEAERIPIFIILRNWATEASVTGDFNLLNYLSHKFNDFDISPLEVENLLKQGKMLMLLDGLDEVPQELINSILQQITYFSDIYYQNHWIITCRLAAQNYLFSGFTYVEIADFDATQIEAFAYKWFVAISGQNREAGLKKAAQFIEKLNKRENQPIRELAATPILLTLLTNVFQNKGDFPNKRSKLYEAGLDILLVQWDEARGIHRDEVYRNLSLSHKIKLLSQIATQTFEEEKYFFEESETVEYIAEYLANLSLPSLSVNSDCSDNDPQSLRLKSAAVLKSMEAQHGLLVERAKGIYSFSHLTFQEYLTAKYIVASIEQTEWLEKLANRVNQPRWKEVFLLTIELLRNAEPLLLAMKAQIDAMMATDSQLQAFLSSLNQKCQSLQVAYKPAAVRAFYLTLFFTRDLGLASALDPQIAYDLAIDLTLDLELTRIFSVVQSLADNPNLKQILALSFALDIDRTLKDFPQLHLCFQQLKKQLPSPSENKDHLIQWWRSNGKTWSELFRDMLVEYRQIGYDWQLNPQQIKLIQDYYQANNLLVDCLRSNCVYSWQVGANIENTLLLPVPA